MSDALHRAGSGEPMLLVHGFSGTWRIWSPILPRLEEHHDVLAVTLDGHTGGAPLDAGEGTAVSALVDGLERVMDDAGFDKAHIVGNSLGGWLALELAARGRARSVVGLSPVGGWEPGGAFERRLIAVQLLTFGALKATQRHVEGWMRRPRLRALLTGATVERPERLPPRVAAEIARDAALTPSYIELVQALGREKLTELAPIDCPVRIAWSGEDKMLPIEVASQRFAELVPESEMVILPGVGHVPMYDDPPLVARAILEVSAAGAPVGAKR